MNRLYLRTTIALVVALACPAIAAAAALPNHATALEDAQAALSRGDYAGAYAEYTRHAAGNPLAQFTLGLFHQQGWGRPVDGAAACRWFGKAARAAIPTARHLSGDCIMQAAVGKDQAARDAAAQEALHLYMGAAQGGHLVSLCSAGALHLRGEGVPRDVAHGLQLCAQAAQADSTPAMLQLAHWYREDRDVAQDLAAARYWYGQAAERGSNEARYQLGILLAQGQGGAPDAGAALAHMEMAAGQGYVQAYLPLATLYAHKAPELDTGAPSAATLAKVYMWSSAALARLSDPALRGEAQRLRALALAVMPSTWPQDLDKQVSAYLENVPAQGAAGSGKAP